MAKILKQDQDYSIGHFVETFHLLDDKLDSTTTSASSASIQAGAALSAALEATTNATQALNEVAIAQSTAQNAVDRLAGDGDYFIGNFPIVTATVATNPASMTNTASQGITWDNTAKKFNFSYLGWYLIVIDVTGDLNNARTDWYQEFTARVKQNTVAINNSPVTIPPSTTKNIRSTITTLVKVGLGDSIGIEFFNIANGTVQAGAIGYVRIKKVV